MDHASEQEMEMEALEAIFMDDMHEDDGNHPSGWTQHAPTYCVAVRPADDAERAHEEKVALELLFAHTPAYPEEPPCVRLRAVQGLGDAEVAAAMAVVQEQIQENMGMSMIYQIYGAVQEWLTERRTAAPGAVVDDSEAARRRALEAEEAKRAAARAHGTPVTIEAFLAWKARYDADAAAERAPAAEASGKGAAADAAAAAARLTGKQWFLRRPAEGEAAAEDDDGSAISEGSDADGLSDYEPGHAGEEEEEEGEGEEEDDDEDFLDDYLATKTGEPAS